MLTPDPILANLLKLIDEPTFKKSTILNFVPTLEKALNDNEEHICILSVKEMPYPPAFSRMIPVCDDPTPNTDRLEDSLPNCLVDMEDPNDKKFKMEEADPRRAKVLKDKLEPIVTALRILPVFPMFVLLPF
jgi:hypothetical protein